MFQISTVARTCYINKNYKIVVWVNSSSYYILQSGRTPLHAAVTSRQNNEQLVETLIKAGTNVNATDKVSYCLTSLCINSLLIIMLHAVAAYISTYVCT